MALFKKMKMALGLGCPCWGRRGFSAPLSFVESECGVLWREDKVH